MSTADVDIDGAVDRTLLRTGESLAPPSQESNEAMLPPSPSSLHESTDSVINRPQHDQPSSPSHDASGQKKSVVLPILALLLAYFLAALDQTIVSTALPTISKELRASATATAWVGTSYLLACTITMPIWGKSSDVFGRKPIILFANAVFFFASLICALSVDVEMLLVGRTLQGVGAGGLMTLVNICISDMFSMRLGCVAQLQGKSLVFGQPATIETRERAMYLSLIGLVFAVASAVGPVLCGAFTDFVTWRWCFYINLPLGGIAFGMLIRFLKLNTPRTPLVEGLATIDWLGAACIIGGSVMLLLGLGFGGASFVWGSAVVVCLIVFGCIMLTAFCVVEVRVARFPIISPAVFSGRSNIATLLANTCHGFVFIASIYFLPLYFQVVLGVSPVLSGVYLLAWALSCSFAMILGGFITRKTGNYLLPLWAGMALLVLGSALYIDLPVYASWARVFLFQLVNGAGVGLQWYSAIIALQAHVQPRDAASAVGAYVFTRTIGTALSIVIGGTILQNEITNRVVARGDAIDGVVAAALEPGAFGQVVEALALLKGSPAESALVVAIYNESLKTLWIFYTAIAGAGFLLSLLVKPRVLDQTHKEVRTGLEAERGKLGERMEEEKARTRAHDQSKA